VKRVARVLVALLVVTSCHSIDRGVFAQGPVPLDVLPLREPITYTAGPNAGQLVPTQHGLLASYFSGAAYVQPAYGEVLDHQQIDPNVDFQWNASGGVNPVIAVGGIDVSEGHPFRPPQWPIWSVVWEGYLDAPASGEYVLNLHVNNGGWLEMKDPAAGLRTVISCPGGSGFEGDCPATVDLAAGFHYIRISYYNNAPSSANAIFSWRRPGDSQFEVVKGDSLCTQDAAGCAARTRLVMLVHGINGDFRNPGFSPLLDTVQRRVGDSYFVLFAYSEDRGNVRDGSCVATQPSTMPDTWHGLPHLLAVPDLDPRCDSQDDVAVNAVLLDDEVKRQAASVQATNVTIVANSMGGAITRTFLAHATNTASRSLELVDKVVFLQAAHQGSYLLSLAEAIRENPVLGPLAPAIETKVKEDLGLDATRPPATQLKPQSELYRYVGRAEFVPNTIDYSNVASDIRVVVLVGLGPFKLPVIVPTVGDYVMMPGSDDPSALPRLGGERFLPASIGRGRSSTQWVLGRTDLVILDPPVVHVPDLRQEPETHLGLGQTGATDRIHVDDPTSRTLTDALIRRILDVEGSP